MSLSPPLFAALYAPWCMMIGQLEWQNNHHNLFESCTKQVNSAELGAREKAALRVTSLDCCCLVNEGLGVWAPLFHSPLDSLELIVQKLWNNRDYKKMHEHTGGTRVFCAFYVLMFPTGQISAVNVE